MTAASFYKLFGEIELKKLEPFLETVNLHEIKKGIETAWQIRKVSGKTVLGIAKEQGSSKQLKEWQQSAKSMVGKELKEQLQRIRVLSVVEYKQVLSGLDEYRRYILEKKEGNF